MKPGNLLKKALFMIVPVSLAVGLIAAAAGYWHAQKVAEESDMRMLTMEAGRAVPAGLLALPAAGRDVALKDALKDMVGGMFAIAAVYAPTGKKIAEAVQPGFEEVSATLGTPAHTAPAAAGSHDSAVVLGQKVLRVFIPLTVRGGGSFGHLEGVRVVSAAELSAFQRAAVESASIAAFSALLCAAILAPLLTDLAAKNLRWAHLMTEAR